MAMQIKRAESGSFTAGSTDDRNAKTLVDRQIGWETASGNLVINDNGTLKAIGKEHAYQHEYHIDYNATSNGDGSYNSPYNSWNNFVTARGSESYLIVNIHNGSNSADIQIDSKTGWTVCGNLETKDGGRSSAGFVTIRGTSTSCYVIGLDVQSELKIQDTAANNYVRYCTMKINTTLIAGTTGYQCFEQCSFMGDMMVTNGAIDILNCQFETDSLLRVMSTGSAVVMCTNTRNISLLQEGGTVVSLGACNFQPSPNLAYNSQTDTFSIVRTAGTSLLLSGESLQSSGALAPIYMEGSGAFSLGKFLFAASGSTLPANNVEVLDALQARQLVDNQTLANINPQSARQSDINYAINNILGNMQGETHERGPVVSAYAAESIYVIDQDNTTINASGSNFAVGDRLFVQIVTPTEQLMQAIASVSQIGGQGEVDDIEWISLGAYSEAQSGIVSVVTDGQGTMCKLDITTIPGQGTKLEDILNPQDGDRVIVLNDETNNNESWMWNYVNRVQPPATAEYKWWPMYRVNSDYMVSGDGVYVEVVDGVVNLTAAKRTLYDSVSSKQNQITGDSSNNLLLAPPATAGAQPKQVAAGLFYASRSPSTGVMGSAWNVFTTIQQAMAARTFSNIGKSNTGVVIVTANAGAIATQLPAPYNTTTTKTMTYTFHVHAVSAADGAPYQAVLYISPAGGATQNDVVDVYSGMLISASINPNWTKLATADDIPSTDDFVTVDTDQSLTGQKIFGADTIFDAPVVVKADLDVQTGYSVNLNGNTMLDVGGAATFHDTIEARGAEFLATNGSSTVLAVPNDNVGTGHIVSERTIEAPAVETVDLFVENINPLAPNSDILITQPVNSSGNVMISTNNVNSKIVLETVGDQPNQMTLSTCNGLAAITLGLNGAPFVGIAADRVELTATSYPIVLDSTAYGINMESGNTHLTYSSGAYGGDIYAGNSSNNVPIHYVQALGNASNSDAANVGYARAVSGWSHESRSGIMADNTSSVIIGPTSGIQWQIRYTSGAGAGTLWWRTGSTLPNFINPGGDDWYVRYYGEHMYGLADMQRINRLETGPQTNWVQIPGALFWYAGSDRWRCHISAWGRNSSVAGMNPRWEGNIDIDFDTSADTGSAQRRWFVYYQFQYRMAEHEEVTFTNVPAPQ